MMPAKEGHLATSNRPQLLPTTITRTQLPFHRPVMIHPQILDCSSRGTQELRGVNASALWIPPAQRTGGLKVGPPPCAADVPIDVTYCVRKSRGVRRSERDTWLSHAKKNQAWVALRTNQGEGVAYSRQTKSNRALDPANGAERGSDSISGMTRKR